MKYKIFVTPELAIKRKRLMLRLGIFLMVMAVIGFVLTWDMKLEGMLVLLFFAYQEFYVWPKLMKQSTAKTS